MSMAICDPIERRLLAAGQWQSPAHGLRRLQARTRLSRVLPEIGGSRRWRSGLFRKHHEERQAALFVFGLNCQAPNFLWEYSMREADDYDFAVRCRPLDSDGPITYEGVQLKEFVPAEINPATSLQAVIDGLTKYCAKPDQRNLVVAICINRLSLINLADLRLPQLEIRQLWLYGSLASGSCFLLNLFGCPQLYHFNDPRPSM
jgi:hypothetical protein